MALLLIPSHPFAACKFVLPPELQVQELIEIVATVGQRGAAVRGQRHFWMREFGYGVVFMWDFRGQIELNFRRASFCVP